MYKVIGNKKILLNHRVTKIENYKEKVGCDMGKIRVYFSNGRCEEYDRIICTFPTAACANIDWVGFN